MKSMISFRLRKASLLTLFCLGICLFPAGSRAASEKHKKMLFDTGVAQGKAFATCLYFTSGDLTRSYAQGMLNAIINGVNSNIDPTGRMGSVIKKNVLKSLPDCAKAWNSY